MGRRDLFALVVDIRPARRKWIDGVTAALAIAAVTAQAVWLFGATRIFNNDIAQFRAADVAIPEHSFVFVTNSPKGSLSCYPEGLEESRFYQFVPALVTIDRASVQPLIFATKGMEAVNFKRRVR